MRGLRMSGKMVRFFMWSHIIGWMLANIQTVWIVWEMRKWFKEVLYEIKKSRRI